ncbi:MAG TPA: hypothetical protein EYH05_13070 [Anaerolineae bacterium]|nr:hypothetical protein [Anaerolineae bacterium]
MSEQEHLDEGLQKLMDDVAGAVPGPSAAAKPSRSTKKRSSRRGRSYRSGLSEGQTDRRKTAKATGKKSVIAGQYLRRSFTFRPDQLDSVEQLASRLGLSQNDLLRWFVDMGIEAVEQGEQPPVMEEVRHRYDPRG